MLPEMEYNTYGVSYRRQNKIQRFSKRRRFSLAAVLFLFLIALALISHSAFFVAAKKTETSILTDPAPLKPLPALQTPKKGAVVTEAAVTSENCGEILGLNDLPVPREEGYNYNEPVPAADLVAADEYFQEAVFIGDSRTEGLQMFGGLQNATYYTAKGLKVDTIFTREVVKTSNGRTITIMEALQQKPFQRVYIMLGVNELGWTYSDLFIEKYGEIITEIKNIAPQAQIYVQSLLPVSKQRSQSDKIYNNANIGRYNGLIQQMAAEKNLYYLDVAQCVADQEGNLAGDASTDGIHLNKTYCSLWVDYLRQHYVL